jgi:hypothetical protein
MLTCRASRSRTYILLRLRAAAANPGMHKRNADYVTSRVSALLQFRNADKFDFATVKLLDLG